VPTPPARPAIVITGASTGIGAACAAAFASRGCLVFAGVRSPADGEALKARVGEGLTPLLLDVTDAASIARAAEQVRTHVGDAGLTGLVNNAGVAVSGPLEVVPIAELRRQFEVNVVGLVAVTQAFLPLLRPARGRIVNIGSIAGRSALPVLGPYSASKHALEAITDALRVEVQPFGIEVSIVEPGAIATPIWQKSQRAAADLEAAVPSEVRALYAEVIARIRGAAERSARDARDPDTVVRVVWHALTAARPRTRYLVGFDAKLRARLRMFLSDRLLDRVLTAALGLPRRPAHTDSSTTRSAKAS
jgi:NAD(P)-dependent dehydrogenase (short-subunit alcohol dehydrogenase family)